MSRRLGKLLFTPDGGFAGRASSTTPEDEERILAAYLDLGSYDKAAAATGFGWSVVQRIAQAAGVVKSRGRHKYPVDHGAFDEPLTEAAAYWIGLIAADGSICRKGGQSVITIALKKTDRDHLRRYLDWVSPTRPLSEKFGKRKTLSAAVLSSAPLVARLVDYGIVGDKTHVMDLKPPAENEAAFWRGFFDGDGCIHVRRVAGNRVQVVTTLVGLRNVLDLYRDWLQRTTGRNISAPYAKANSTTSWLHRVSSTGTHLPIAVLRALYTDATIYLSRKCKLWQEAESKLQAQMGRNVPNRSGTARSRRRAA